MRAVWALERKNSRRAVAKSNNTIGRSAVRGNLGSHVAAESQRHARGVWRVFRGNARASCGCGPVPWQHNQLGRR